MSDMTLYQRILESNLVNFIIMVSILVLIFKKAKLGAIFDKMAGDIKTSVMTSAEACEFAIKEYKEAKRSVKNLDNIKYEIKQKAELEIERTKEAFNDAVSKENNALEAQFDARINADTLKVKEDTTKEFLDVVVFLVKNEIQKRLSSSFGAEIQLKLIDKCIDEVNEIDFSEVKI